MTQGFESRNAAARPGDRLELSVSAAAYGGAGISRDGGIVTFVRRAMPGETVLAEIVSVRKNFMTARAVEILRPSPDRIDSQCLLPDGRPVPGCEYDFATHGAELAIKDSLLRDFLRSVAGESTVFLPPFASPRDLGYRNKTAFHVSIESGRTVAGYCADGSRAVVDIDRCPLSMPEINEAWAETGRRIRASRPAVRTVTLRHTERDGTVVWSDASEPPLARLTERSPVGDLTVPAAGFFQVNPDVAAGLVETVHDWCAEIASSGAADLALDICCGVGVFSFAALQAGFARAIGVETARPAVKCARLNARRLAHGNAEFFCRDAGEFLADTAGRLPMDRAVAIADPPRSGLQRNALDALCASPLRHAVFVSCDPATLARDLAVAAKAGFAVRRARLFDMFPRTAHFETAVLLERQ